MEIMEDGNLMDKVLILIQRDMEYYKEKQTVLQETICPGVVGGRLDFPRYASFAAVKLVLWWEEEFLAGFRKASGLIQVSTNMNESLSIADEDTDMVKTSDPEQFVTLICKSSDQLLEHLHVLTQEALDHADLTVLTGTIGAAALLKNCLWFYVQLAEDNLKPSLNGSLQVSHKHYQEMVEALAERLLDLHSRLLSLYILQEAESLDWENIKPFFESERGSYVIQMWWLYMQGTRRDLWNTVPPKMAQRVLAGMLNESLTILTVRYTQSRPSENRSKLLAVDISNLLLCVAHLLQSICNSAEELAGLVLNTQSKILRDIHAKCQELLVCLVLRGAPLDILYKVFRKGVDNMNIFRSRNTGPSPWVVLALSDVFKDYPKGVVRLHDFQSNSAIALELYVLLAQPQPNWALLLKVLGMRDGKILKEILTVALKRSNNASCVRQSSTSVLKNCEGFLCTKDGTCNEQSEHHLQLLAKFDYYELTMALVHVLLSIGNVSDLSSMLLSAVDKFPNWAQCFDRRQVWDQNRPAWYEAILDLIKPFLAPITTTVISAVQTGASMYQAMTIVLACFSQLWDCVNLVIPQVAFMFQDVLPADVIPLGKSALLQLLISALYTELLGKSEEKSRSVKFATCPNSKAEEAGSSKTASLKKQQSMLEHGNSICSFDGSNSSPEAIALAIAEALCSIDEDDKHTEEIDDLLTQAKLCLENEQGFSDGCKRVEQNIQISEVLVSDLLMSSDGKKSLKIIYKFITNNYEWILKNLHVTPTNESVAPNCAHSVPEELLHTVFHVGHRSFDQLLTGEWQPDWCNLLNTPMGLNMERVWNQISLRWEFNDIHIPSLSCHDALIVSKLSSMLKQA